MDSNRRAIYVDGVRVGRIVKANLIGKWMAFYGVERNESWVGSYTTKASAKRRVLQFARGQR